MSPVLDLPARAYPPSIKFPAAAICGNHTFHPRTAVNLGSSIPTLPSLRPLPPLPMPSPSCEIIDRLLRPKIAGNQPLPRAGRFVHDADVYAAAPTTSRPRTRPRRRPAPGPAGISSTRCTTSKRAGGRRAGVSTAAAPGRWPVVAMGRSRRKAPPPSRANRRRA